MEEQVMEKEQRWKSLRLRGLRQRWVFNSILPIGALLVLVVTLFSAVPISCVPSALSETERVRFSPFLSIYIGFPFCSIADSNGMIYPMQHKACRVKKTEKSG